MTAETAIRVVRLKHVAAAAVCSLGDGLAGGQVEGCDRRHLRFDAVRFGDCDSSGGVSTCYYNPTQNSRNKMDCLQSTDLWRKWQNEPFNNPFVSLLQWSRKGRRQHSTMSQNHHRLKKCCLEGGGSSLNLSVPVEEPDKCTLPCLFGHRSIFEDDHYKRAELP